MPFESQQVTVAKPPEIVPLEPTQIFLARFGDSRAMRADNAAIVIANPNSSANTAANADFFNLFNKANFLNVNTNVSNPDYGAIASAAPGRNIQFALRLTF